MGIREERPLKCYLFLQKQVIAMCLYVGKSVTLKPSISDSKNEKPVTGTVAYIHPSGRFYTVEFKSSKGRYTESFTPSNEQVLELIRAGTIVTDEDKYSPPPQHMTGKELEDWLHANGIVKAKNPIRDLQPLDDEEGGVCE